MKLRLGFVSNSSTSSFVMVGIRVDRYEFTDNDDEDEDKLDELENKVYDAELRMKIPEGDDYIYIGHNIFGASDSNSVEDENLPPGGQIDLRPFIKLVEKFRDTNGLSGEVKIYQGVIAG